VTHLLLLALLMLGDIPADGATANRYAKATARLAAAHTGQDRFYALRGAAKAAFEVGKLDEARTYANELLRAAQQFRGDWNYGNAIHDGHLVLGRLAMREGDVAQAKKELLAAGNTPGSPQLDTFGPNMSLASDLLQHGEREVVLEYFRRCERFWESGGESLAAWRKAIAGGNMPDFGANLRY
jgi:tetratricopeptide (TPR) repeat protein